MFTGIIEETGIVKAINKKEQGAVITIECKLVLEDLKLGDSVAINGACQTIVSLANNSFDVDAAFETLKLTNLGDLKPGEAVNLERAMPSNGRFGGHIVSGHIEGLGTLIKKESKGLAEIFYFEAPGELLKYMVYKGSICINGISLTIASLNNNIFSISVIPHTIKETTLPNLKIKDKVNLETDIIAKYIENFVQKADNTSKINEEFLKENGFF